MIPAFSNFKKIEVTDREAVETHTHKYEPYSDFNFTSLWAWDTSGERMISELNNNLVVRFTDYSTHEPFLSFLGNNETEHTARTLIDYCKTEGLPTTLKLVPEVSVKEMRPSVMRVEEDRDNFDYIYSVPKLAAMRGSEYMTKRGKANKFRREHAEAHVEVIDFASEIAQKDIAKVIRIWEKKKIENKKKYELEHERAAIVRLSQTADSHNLTVTGVFQEDSMLAFSIEETLPNEHSICHFWKADSSHTGIFDFLMQEKTKHLETQNVQYINYEQDLGIPTLRVAKAGFRPTTFLKKYTLDLATP